MIVGLFRWFFAMLASNLIFTACQILFRLAARLLEAISNYYFYLRAACRNAFLRLQFAQKPDSL